MRWMWPKEAQAGEAGRANKHDFIQGRSAEQVSTWQSTGGFPNASSTCKDGKLFKWQKAHAVGKANGVLWAVK